LTFNWILTEKADTELLRFCVDLEYDLRKKITKFLIPKVENECCPDFDCFYFDVDVLERKVSVSKKTPPQYFQLIAADFDVEITHKCY